PQDRHSEAVCHWGEPSSSTPRVFRSRPLRRDCQRARCTVGSMEAGTVDQRALAAARTVAASLGVPCEQATVVHSASNVLVHLLPSPVVARVMTGTVVLHDDPERWLSHEVAVLSFLAPTGSAVAPSPLVAPGPYQSDGLWMTFWGWLELQGPTDLRDG